MVEQRKVASESHCWEEQRESCWLIFFFLSDEETEEERKENLPQCKRMSVTGLGFEPKPHEQDLALLAVVAPCGGLRPRPGSGVSGEGVRQNPPMNSHIQCWKYSKMHGWLFAFCPISGP